LQYFGHNVGTRKSAGMVGSKGMMTSSECKQNMHEHTAII